MLKIVHVELAEANAYVERLHRHHPPVTGHRFSIGLLDTDTNELVGVVIVGRPVARKTSLDVLEVLRLCTNGTPNACSKLYGAAAKAGKILGYTAIQTFILSSESGISLKAAGWKYDGESSGKPWKRSNGAFRANVPTTLGPKQRWILKYD